MAMGRYEKVLKNASQVSTAALTREIFFQQEERNFVSPSGHVTF